MDVEGEIVAIGDEQRISDRFKKREVVVRIGSGEYPQDTPFELVNDRCDLADGLNVGDRVVVDFSIGGNQGRDGRYWPRIRAWGFVVDGEAQGGPASAPATDPVPVPGSVADDDEIPF